MLDSIALAEEVGVCVAAAAGFGEDDQYKIGLAVHEGVMNAFQYGNEQKREKKIHVIFELLNEKKVNRVEEQGNGFRVEEVSDTRMDDYELGVNGRCVSMVLPF